jgi:uncharacterized protein (TIGR03435 family)
MSWFVTRAIAILLASVATAAPAFEVASIKPSPADSLTIGLELRHGRLKGSNITLKAVLATAYGVAEPRIFGPDWLDKDRFDWIAKSPDGVPDSAITPMLQALLSDRFQLTAHRETKEMSVYDLVVAKGRVKMAVYPAEAHQMPPHARGFPMMIGTFTMFRLADSLSRAAGRPVFDRTGLTERYNLALTFAPISPRTGDAPELAPPDLFAAVQEQLGLKLEPKKEGVEVIVVDHIARTPPKTKRYW